MIGYIFPFICVVAGADFAERALFGKNNRWLLKGVGANLVFAQVRESAGHF